MLRPIKLKTWLKKVEKIGANKPVITTIRDSDPFLYNIITFYFSTQEELSRTECTGLNVSELSAIMKSLHQKNGFVKREFYLEIPKDKAVVHYYSHYPFPVNPTEGSFPVDGFSLCNTVHKPSKKRGFPGIEFQRYIYEGKTKLPLPYMESINPDELWQTFYYCVRLNMLNRRGLLRDIYIKACLPEEYHYANVYVAQYNEIENKYYPNRNKVSMIDNSKNDKRKRKTDRRARDRGRKDRRERDRREKDTDPRVFSQKVSCGLWNETKGNLLINTYGQPMISSIAMSCLDERAFCVSMVTYLIGIINQEHHWMRYELIVDLLRTFTAAIQVQDSKRSRTINAFNKSATEYMEEFRDRKDCKFYSLVNDLFNIKEFSKHPFTGYNDDDPIDPEHFDMFVVFLENICFALANNYRNDFRNGLLKDKEVLYFHWEKLFIALGKPIKSRNAFREEQRKRRVSMFHEGHIDYRYDNISCMDMDDKQIKEYINGFIKNMKDEIPLLDGIDVDYTLKVDRIFVERELRKPS